jgi:hypothetical protein
MSYLSWFQAHSKKHALIVKKLRERGFNDEAIIDYFDFESMCINEPDFCPLYAKNKKCHDMEHLNCYLCACPNFRFNDKGFCETEGSTQFSFCSIASQEGKQGHYGNAIHQDCSQCTVPHHKAYVKKNFHDDWLQMMNQCDQN